MIDILTSHTSVRDYTDEPISIEKLHQFIKAGQHASSSNFVQAYSVIYVTDCEIKKQLGKLSNNERQINHAPVTLVFCADLKRFERIASVHNKPFLGSTTENFIVSTVDTALFAQNVAIAAESEGYGICFIGGIRNEVKAISELLALPHFVAPLFAMTIGVPKATNEVKPRLPLDAILHENEYDESKYDALIEQYDETMKNYYKNRQHNKKYSNWSLEMATFFERERRKHMKAFLEEKGFNLT